MKCKMCGNNLNKSIVPTIIPGTYYVSCSFCLYLYWYNVPDYIPEVQHKKYIRKRVAGGTTI